MGAPFMRFDWCRAARLLGTGGTASRGSGDQRDYAAGLVAVTRWVPAHGPPHHIRQPRLRRRTSVKPSSASCRTWRRVAQRSAIARRPPGRSTRAASLTALARAALVGMLWITRLL